MIPDASWADRGRAAVFLVVLITLLVIIARWLRNHIAEAAGNEEDEIVDQASFAPQHSGGRSKRRVPLFRRG